MSKIKKLERLLSTLEVMGWTGSKRQDALEMMLKVILAELFLNGEEIGLSFDEIKKVAEQSISDCYFSDQGGEG